MCGMCYYGDEPRGSNLVLKYETRLRGLKM